MSKTLSKEQIEAVFAKFDANKVQTTTLPLKLAAVQCQSTQTNFFSKIFVTFFNIVGLLTHYFYYTDFYKDGKLSKEEFKNLMENRK